jgi:DNA-binding HxlR family transcriptional regulator
MRSYGQYCSIARALDVVGDRWTLLIVRELLLQGPCRFTDVKNGLPGVAANLLSTRLKELEDAGLITREDAPPPVATALYALSEDGLALEPVLKALGLWGLRFMTDERPDDAFQARWLAYAPHVVHHRRRSRRPTRGHTGRRVRRGCRHRATGRRGPHPARPCHRPGPRPGRTAPRRPRAAHRRDRSRNRRSTGPVRPRPTRLAHPSPPSRAGPNAYSRRVPPMSSDITWGHLAAIPLAGGRPPAQRHGIRGGSGRAFPLERGHPDHWIVMIHRTGVPVGDVEVPA